MAEENQEVNRYFDNLEYDETSLAVDQLGSKFKNQVLSVILPLHAAANQAMDDGNDNEASLYVDKIVDVAKNTQIIAETNAEHMFNMQNDLYSNYTKNKDNGVDLANATFMNGDRYEFDEDLNIKIRNFDNNLISIDELRRNWVFSDDFKEDERFFNEVATQIYQEKDKSGITPINAKMMVDDILKTGAWKEIVSGNWAGLNFPKDVIGGNKELTQAAVDGVIDFDFFNPKNNDFIRDYLIENLEKMKDGGKNKPEKTIVAAPVKPKWESNLV